MSQARDARGAPDGGATEGLERALESLRGESEVAQALLGLSAALAEVRSVDETLELMVSQVPPLFGAERGFAASLDRSGGRLGISATAGYDAALEAVLRHPSGQDDLLVPLRSALGGREPVLVQGDEPALASLGPLHGVGSLLILPLARAGVDFGVLGVEFTEPGRFDPKDLALARGVVHQCAMALTNARQLDLLRGLREFGLRIGRRLRLRGVAQDITGGAAKLLDADAALLYFADPGGTRLAPSRVAPIPPWLPPSFERFDLTSPPWSRLIEGETLSSRELAGAEGMSGSELSVLAAPILTGRSPILGAVVVVFRGSRTLRREDGEALNVLGAQAGMAITNARRFERQRRVARHLQAGLLRTTLPVIKNFDVGTVYKPASGESEVGGDFFDVFELPDGRHGFMVGDVSGKGAEAAAQTAMAKYMLRAFCMREPDPALVLQDLNSALVQTMGEERFTTLIYGVIDGASCSCSMASGGHPAPLIHRRSQGIVEALETPGGILGLFENQRYTTLDFDLMPGDVFLCYTDGLLEVRSDGELYGRDRVARSLVDQPPESGAPDLAQRIFEAAQGFGEVTDDTVVFALICTASDGPAAGEVREGRFSGVPAV
ncbi:hypothetical protein BH20ACT22_BH20ACT22_12370 [soil metagenome]